MKQANQSLHRTAALLLGGGWAGFIGRWIRCRRPLPAAVGEFNRWATMRALLQLSLFLVFGCATTWSGDLIEIGAPPGQSATNMVVRRVLGTNVQTINFLVPENTQDSPGEDRVKVSLSNSCERTIVIRIPGAFADVPPHTNLELFPSIIPLNKSASEPLGRQQFSIWSWSAQAHYELHIQFASPRPTGVLKWTPIFGPVAKLDFPGSAEDEKPAER